MCIRDRRWGSRPRTRVGPSPCQPLIRSRGPRRLAPMHTGHVSTSAHGCNAGFAVSHPGTPSPPSAPRSPRWKADRQFEIDHESPQNLLRCGDLVALPFYVLAVEGSMRGLDPRYGGGPQRPEPRLAEPSERSSCPWWLRASPAARHWRGLERWVSSAPRSPSQGTLPAAPRPHRSRSMWRLRATRRPPSPLSLIHISEPTRP